MAVTTSISKSYLRWMLIFTITCLVIGLWGVYDYTVKLPAHQRQYDRFLEVQLRLDELIELRETRDAEGQSMKPEEIQEYESLEEEMKLLAPSGENPVPPSKFDWVFQWACILSLPFVPYFIVQIQRAKKQSYGLDDEGTLHLPGDQGSWTAQDIEDIDMSRWMKKSVAHVVHTDGRRVKLDDYIHQNMAKIVGTLAHRFHPEAWDEDARQVKTDADSTSTTDANPDEDVSAG